MSQLSTTSSSTLAGGERGATSSQPPTEQPDLDAQLCMLAESLRVAVESNDSSDAPFTGLAESAGSPVAAAGGGAVGWPSTGRSLDMPGGRVKRIRRSESLLQYQLRKSGSREVASFTNTPSDSGTRLDGLVLVPVVNNMGQHRHPAEVARCDSSDTITSGGRGASVDAGRRGSVTSPLMLATNASTLLLDSRASGWMCASTEDGFVGNSMVDGGMAQAGSVSGCMPGTWVCATYPMHAPAYAGAGSSSNNSVGHNFGHALAHIRGSLESNLAAAGSGGGANGGGGGGRCASSGGVQPAHLPLQVQPSTDGAGNLLSTSHSLASWRPLDSQDVNTSSTRGAAGEGGDTPQPGWTGARQLARLRAVNQARTSLDVSETCLVHSVTSKVLKKLQEGGQSPAAGGVASGLGPHSNGPWRSHPAAAAAPISGFASGPNAIGADGLWRGVCSGGSQLPPRPSQAGAGWCGAWCGVGRSPRGPSDTRQHPYLLGHEHAQHAQRQGAAARGLAGVWWWRWRPRGRDGGGRAMGVRNCVGDRRAPHVHGLAPAAAAAVWRRRCST